MSREQLKDILKNLSNSDNKDELENEISGMSESDMKRVIAAIQELGKNAKLYEVSFDGNDVYTMIAKDGDKKKTTQLISANPTPPVWVDFEE